MAGKFVLTKTKAGKYMFTLKASNGQIILSGETYSTKQTALDGIESVRKNSVKRPNFQERMAKNGKPYFVLMAPNGEIIGQSEMYSSNTSMRHGIMSVAANARSAAIEDNTG